MQRRSVIMAVAAAPWTLVRAGHDWDVYDRTAPFYLEGEVTLIIWADPHPHLELLHRPQATLPADLRFRSIPEHKEVLDTRQLLHRARVAPALDSRVWRVELPSLARLNAWNLRRPKIKEVLGVIGFAGPPVTGTSTLQAEILFIGDKAYPLRSDPA